MKSALENPVNSIRKLNFIAFTVLLVSVLIYQTTVLLQHDYITDETVEFGLNNQERLLSQKIEQNLISSLIAPDYLSRDRYINNARQDINTLLNNHQALLNKAVHFPLFHGKDDITYSVYEEAGAYLEQMRDAVFVAVANSEKLDFNDAEQQSLRQAVDSYRQNQQLFTNLIERAADLSNINAKGYMTQLPWLSWCLVALIFFVMIFNHRLIYRRSMTAAKKQFHQLEERLEFQNALLSSPHEAIITLSKEGTVTLFSSSACRMFGYQKEEVIGKNICQLMSDNSSIYCLGCLAANTLRICHLINIRPEKIELQGLRKNGGTFPILLELDELKTANQHLFIGFIRDLTTEKEAEIKLLQAKQEAEEANKAKSQFLSNMTHELKTPLNAILGFSQLLETNETEPLTPEQAECVQYIYQAGKLLLALIGDILDLSKIETGNVKLNIEEVSVNEVILEALNLINNIAKEHHINIKTRFDPLATTMIRVDGLRFKQILINLLSNAIKYNSENGLIVLRSKIEHSRVRISVKDSGKGIDESKLMQLFQPFNRLGAEKSEIEGTGIGLCIAKNLVERMGGTIGVTNNADVGCCFWVEFPIIKQKATAKEHATEVNRKLYDEITQLQESLNVIGLVKKSEPTENLPPQAVNTAPEVKSSLH